MYFEVQTDGMLERMKWPVIIRATGMMLLYSLIAVYANQRMPYKLLSSKDTSLIRNTDKSIKEIADSLNFPNASAFGTFFKKQVGMSPVNYRLKEE